MHIDTKTTINQYKNNFRGQIIRNRTYKDLKRFSESTPYFTNIFKNIEMTIKNYPEEYQLKIDLSNSKRPSTTQLGLLKQGLFKWIKTTKLFFETPFNSYNISFDGKDNLHDAMEFLKCLTNPFGEVSQILFPNQDFKQTHTLSTTNDESKHFKAFKNQIIDKKTGNVNYKTLHDIEFYINHLVEDKEEPPIEIFKFLTNLSEDPVLSIEMARQFSKDPRCANNLKHKLIKLLGAGEEGEELFNIWYYDEVKGYRNAYSNYFNKVIWEESNTLDDLVKQSPNLATFAFRKFVKERNIEPTLGTLPKEFGTRDDFAKLITELKIWNKNFSKNSSKNRNKIKSFELDINNRKFNIIPLDKGISAKLKYKITPISNSCDTYILKFAPYDAIGNTDRSRKFRDNQAARPDMPYTDALIDFYLKLNKCKNAPDIKFFDYEVQAVLYEETKGIEPEFPKDYQLNIYKFRKQKEIADVYNLGVELNDIWKTNFLIDRNGILKCIDTGHAKYNNLFRPLVIGKHFALSNMCGRELNN